MRRPLTGRADLLLALASEEAVVADVAERLGFEHVQQLPEPGNITITGLEIGGGPIEVETELAPRPPVPYWHAESFAIRQIIRTPPPAPPDDGDGQDEVTLARFDPLATMAEVLTRLRQVADLTRPGSRVDVDRLVFEISRGRQLTEIPRLNRRSWGQGLHIVIDLARRLVPYRRDQKMIGRAMKRLLPKGGGTVSVLREGCDTPIIEWPGDQAGQELHPPPGSIVLVLSDLGTQQQSNSRAAEDRWTRIGRKLRDRECAALAMVPCRPDAVPPRLARLWTLIPWERRSGRRPKPLDAVTVAACERILALVSPAARIEPRLLRAVRKLLPEGRRDPGLESTIWQMCQGTTHCSAAALTKEQVADLRESVLGDDLKQQAWSLIEAAHRDEYAGVACLEVLNLGKEAARFGAGKHVERSRQWMRGIGQGEAEFGGDFFRKAADQLTPEAWQTVPELHALWNQYCSDGAVPDGYDPALAGVDAPLQTVRVSLLGDQIEFRRQGDAAERSTPLATVRLKNPQIVVDEFDDWPADDEDSEALWAAEDVPAWADRWGRDKVGPWVEFVVDDARQRMRWIAPGEFLMGSPEGEEGRSTDEGPQQAVTIGTGFWLFDTPCTQALWQAVSGENPSRFKGDLRPVENVDLEDCERFLKRLNDRCPGLNLNLPTEAEWEYACRAGTKTSTYAGNLEIDENDENGHAPGLENIAWYSANSGNKTHDVGMKSPNAWGLHDMLGNVWEWCRDHAYRQYGAKPLYVTGESIVPRVVRGGSWVHSARLVRAASRFGISPGERFDALGFRCSSSGSEPAGEGGRRPKEGAGRRPELVRSQGAVSGRRPKAEPAGDSEPASDDRSVRTTTRDAEYKPIPQGPIVRLRTDLEDVFLCKVPHPTWASRVGRDQYGLWAEFTIPQKQADEVTQRLRWIPPGRFLMGSPESEKGRRITEGPQHEATIGEGFWLFNTPCTQALWEVVMARNPSDSKGSRRPVEQVNWEDCQEFVAKFADLVPALPLQLPSETQWEYACRAGTETSTYAGSFDPDDEASQEELQRIAWYDRNSESRTHNVAELLPNPWGLHDMLGNVWEWCQDMWLEIYELKLETDEPSASRVIRGGSWDNFARNVRAASRSGSPPGERIGYLGFRCSSSGEPGGQVAREEPERSGRSRRGAGGDSAVKSDDS
ncbi:MAG: sulfatase activating formylglycine-generating enzyme [Planctomycetaceae bacterium]|jgi:formylglycine-generating enzyme required for sulfatase activity